MLSPHALRDLLRHMEWADALVWRAVLQAGVDDPRLRQLLTHIHGVQYAFLAIWSGADVSAVFKKDSDFAALDEMRDWAHAYFPRVHAYVDQVSEARLAERVEMPWAAHITGMLGHPPGPTTFAETCFQVTSHSTYHRGQVNARLRELGVPPPLVDYIAWLWAGRPDAEWNA